jgi:hypothetical protein
LKFRRQCRIGNYVADFYCVEAALAIEVDGGIHSQPSQLRKDAAKESFFKKRGIHVLRVPNGMVLEHPEEFVKKVHDTLTHRLAVPPLPAGRGLMQVGAAVLAIADGSRPQGPRRRKPSPGGEGGPQGGG